MLSSVDPRHNAVSAFCFRIKREIQRGHFQRHARPWKTGDAVHVERDQTRKGWVGRPVLETVARAVVLFVVEALIRGVVREENDCKLDLKSRASSDG